MHYTYDDILKAAKERGREVEGFHYAIIVLHAGDTCDNPASTKHSIWGPCVVVWEIHPSGVHAFRYNSVDEIGRDVREWAATLDTEVTA